MSDPLALPGSRRTADFVSVPGRMELTGRLLVRPASEHREEARRLLERFPHEVAPELEIWSIEVPPGQDENSLAAQLATAREGDHLFEWIRPDWRVYVQAAAPLIPNDPEFALQWHHQTLRSAQAWRTTIGLPEVVVAFVDTGVDLSHPDLMPNLVGGYCSYLTVRLPQSQSGTVDDAHGHGTSVAGVAAAAGNNSLGVVGIGWDLSIMPIRATNPTWPSGGATSMDIINGALWAANHGARVVNVSFSGVGEPYVQSLGAQLRAMRVLLVWPVDNFNTNYGSTFDHSDVLVVGGTDTGDNRAPGSSYGAGIDLCAPSVQVFSTIRGGASWWQNGNSFAAPIVAGAAGLVLSAATELTPAHVQRVLEETAADLGAPGKDPYFGHGRIDLERALWLAPLRQFALGMAPAPGIRGQYSIDDLYSVLGGGRDINGDAVVDAADLQAVEGLLRYDEAVAMTARSR